MQNAALCYPRIKNFQRKGPSSLKFPYKCHLLLTLKHTMVSNKPKLEIAMKIRSNYIRGYQET